MQLYLARNIVWDIDDDPDDSPLGLPAAAYVHCEDADDVADCLSDEHGFCIKSLSVELVVDELVLPTTIS